MSRAFRFRHIVAATSIAAAATILPSLPASASSVPYTDNNVNGFIGLCNRAGQPVTSGSLLDVPFVWTAVSSSPAPAGYGQGKATLYVYQPRQTADPSQWSGQQLTGSSAFSNPAHPMTQSTNGDPPLLFAAQNDPPQWDGLLQLRIYYTGINMEPHMAPYPATAIRITGNRWSVVSGGNVGCNVGHATSDEGPGPRVPPSVVLHTGTIPPSGGTKGLSSPSSTTSPKSSATTRGSSPRSSSSSTTAGSQSTNDSKSASGPLAGAGGSGGGGLSGGAIALIAIGAALASGGAATALYRRRQRGAVSNPL